MAQSAGVHLIVDGYVADGDVFTAEKLTKLFQDLAQSLEMTILKGPDFLEVPVDPAILERVRETGVFADEGGVTGTCIISTSHMSIHCWPLQRFFSLDAFSCKSFDYAKALALVRGRLAVTEDNVTVMNRVRPRAP